MKRASPLLCAALAAALTLAACSSRPVRAPVLERAPLPAAMPAAPPPPAMPAVAMAPDMRPDAYTVRSGDTLFSIALDHGLDYKELAAWNNLSTPGVLRPGQQLRIKPPAGVQEAPVTVNPVTLSERVETRPLGAPVPAPARTEPAARPPGAEDLVKSEPLARKLPYSPENVALLQRSEAQAKPPPGPAAQAPALAPAPALTPAPVPAPAAVPKQDPAPSAAPKQAPAPGAAPKQEPAPAAAPKQEPAGKTDADIGDEDRVEWGWPTQGKILAGFSEASNKGLDIAGKPGDPVIASAPGRVVYSGSGLRGYGKLVIIKHNKTYLSAYAHNKDVFVKEGQSVLKGQKIAEVGSTDTDVPKLHFEIRKLGKPVDPAKYLPPS